MMENRNGLVVAAEVTQSATVAERATALRMLDRTVAPKEERNPEQKITLGVDTQYQDEKVVQDLREREVAAHVGNSAFQLRHGLSRSASIASASRRTLSRRRNT
jgi:hypothetical protein